MDVRLYWRLWNQCDSYGDSEPIYQQISSDLNLYKTWMKARFWGLMKWLDCEWFEFLLHSEHKRPCQRKPEVKVKSAMFGMASYCTVYIFAAWILCTVCFFWMHIVPGWCVTVVCIMQQSLVLNTVTQSISLSNELNISHHLFLDFITLVRLCTKFD